MRIQVERSGGFAGLSRRVSVDTEKLAPEEAREIEARVRALDLDSAGRAAASGEALPDAFQYDVVIEDGSVRREIRLRDPTPPGFQDLFRQMLELQRRS